MRVPGNNEVRESLRSSGMGEAGAISKGGRTGAPAARLARSAERGGSWMRGLRRLGPVPAALRDCSKRLKKGQEVGMSHCSPQAP